MYLMHSTICNQLHPSQNAVIFFIMSNHHILQRARPCSAIWEIRVFSSRSFHPYHSVHRGKRSHRGATRQHLTSFTFSHIFQVFITIEKETTTLYLCVDNQAGQMRNLCHSSSALLRRLPKGGRLLQTQSHDKLVQKLHCEKNKLFSLPQQLQWPVTNGISVERG